MPQLSKKTYNWVPNEAPPREAICDLLYDIGEIANHTGFFHTVHAIWLAAREPSRLTHPTKWLYPDVAAHYRTSRGAVEQSIRRTVNRIWRRKKEQLNGLAGGQLYSRPKAAEFLSIMVLALEREFPQLSTLPVQEQMEEFAGHEKEKT